MLALLRARQCACLKGARLNCVVLVIGIALQAVNSLTEVLLCKNSVVSFVTLLNNWRSVISGMATMSSLVSLTDGWLAK